MAKLFVSVNLHIEIDVDDAVLDDDSIINAAVSTLDDQISNLTYSSISRDITPTAIRVAGETYDLDF